MKKNVVNFFPHASEFQDLSSGEKVGSVKECADGYILKLRTLEGYTMMSLLASIYLVFIIIEESCFHVIMVIQFSILNFKLNYLIKAFIFL